MDIVKDIAIILGVVIAVLGVGAVAISYLGGSQQKAAIAALQVTVATLETSRDTFKSELAEERTKNEKLELKVAEQGVQIKTLLEQRPSQELITDMANTLKDHHRDTSIILNSIHDAVTSR